MSMSTTVKRKGILELSYSISKRNLAATADFAYIKLLSDPTFLLQNAFGVVESVLGI